LCTWKITAPKRGGQPSAKVSGAAGYVLRKANFDAGPFVMAFGLARMVDTSLRQGLLMGDGSPIIFLTRPISGTIIGLALLWGVSSFGFRGVNTVAKPI
jgi:putative tricarboxylic transport membrane protein